jgi:hypothetical protein
MARRWLARSAQPPRRHDRRLLASTHEVAMPALSRPLNRWAAIVASIMLIALLPATVSATDPVNDPPIAVDDPGDECGYHGLPGDPPPFGGAYPVVEDYRGEWPPIDYQLQLCGPLENDSDPNGDPLTWDVVTPPGHGDVVQFDPTIFGYRPEPDYSTKPGDVPGGDWYSDSFTYRAYDGSAYSNVATWRYWVMPVNDPPTYSAGEDVWVLEDSGTYRAPWATNVSPGPANESDQAVHFDLDPTMSGQSFGPGPLFAELPAIDDTGMLTFVLTPGVTGYAHVTFHVKDDGGTAPDYTQGTQAPPPDDTAADASFTIHVQFNEVVTEDDVLGLSEDPSPNPWPVPVLGNDTYPPGSRINWVTQGQLGTVSIAPDGQSLLYSPSPNANGSDSFTYTVISSGTGDIDTATVSVTIDPVNDSPVARSDAATVARNASATDVPVLANDTDIDGDILAIINTTNGSRGTVVVSTDRRYLTYQPARNVDGTDSFSYSISDGHGGIATTIVQITILKVKGPKG